MSRKLPHSYTCFVCGETNPKGLNIRFYAEEEGASVPILLREEQMGYPGVAHGGVLMSILDELMGWAGTLQTGEFSVSAEISVRFLKPVTIHTPLTARARMTGRRGKVWYVQGEIVDEQGTVYVRAAGKYVSIGKERTAEILKRMIHDPDALSPEELWQRWSQKE
ncbi:MAG: hotdog domain-containing protein [Armatimonadota bacterium]|nr:hotdog fold thioesterase [bacterium]MCS7309278.1 hotdog fold thioesterase [Armatimonadota bacterium]MDW8104997.1 hotdog domain-containing protein [Armatimonadota bacterium]MDW8289083.1 hotdog domain-containing protein [Armatimonadota bacterium]